MPVTQGRHTAGELSMKSAAQLPLKKLSPKRSTFVCLCPTCSPDAPEGSLSVHEWTWRHLQPLKAEIPCQLSLRGTVASPGRTGTLLAIFTVTNGVDGILDVLFCGKLSNLGRLYCVRRWTSETLLVIFMQCRRLWVQLLWWFCTLLMRVIYWNVWILLRHFLFCARVVWYKIF